METNKKSLVLMLLAGILFSACQSVSDKIESACNDAASGNTMVALTNLDEIYNERQDLSPKEMAELSIAYFRIAIKLEQAGTKESSGYKVVTDRMADCYETAVRSDDGNVETVFRGLKLDVDIRKHKAEFEGNDWNYTWIEEPVSQYALYLYSLCEHYYSAKAYEKMPDLIKKLYNADSRTETPSDERTKRRLVVESCMVSVLSATYYEETGNILPEFEKAYVDASELDPNLTVELFNRLSEDLLDTITGYLAGEEDY